MDSDLDADEGAALGDRGDAGRARARLEDRADGRADLRELAQHVDGLLGDVPPLPAAGLGAFDQARQMRRVGVPYKLAIGAHSTRSHSRRNPSWVVAADMERWVGSVRRELLDRILIMKARHLRKVLAEYESRFNGYRPHRALNYASPFRLPVDADINVIRRDRLKGLLHAYAQVA